MKKLLLLFAMVLSLNLANKASAQLYGSISFNTFYNELSPYGRWVNDIDYGQVWIADAPGFEPYYNNGHWTYTTYGWTWVSDYPWGWAPFHYGRWAYLPAWGWAWVPGYEWGPAWVSWCQNDGYFGWAPLGPGFGYYRSFNAVPHNYWRFVRQQYITGPELRDRIVRPDRNPNLFRNASFINNREERDNVTYNIGPRREAVERITRQRIATRPVAFMGTDEKPTGNALPKNEANQQPVRIYRPVTKPGQAAANNSNRAVDQDRLPKNNPLTKGEAIQQQQAGNNNAPANDAGNRPVRMLPKDRIRDDKNELDNQQAIDRRRLMIEKQQAVQAQKNGEERPLPNNQPDINRQANDEQRRLWQQQANERKQDQLNKQQDLERRQQLQQQQDEQRKQREQQLQQQANERQRQAQLDQQRRDQQQRDNELRQQPEQQRQQQAEQRSQQNEQRQNDLRQQRMQQQDNFQRQTEQRTQRSFERPIRNVPIRKPIEK